MTGERGPLSGERLFDAIAAALHHLCRHEQEQIRVHIAAVSRFFLRRHKLRVVRHRRDPENLFDNSRDEPVDLERGLRDRIEGYARQFVRDHTDLVSATITVYPDGNWSYGGSSKIGSSKATAAKGLSQRQRSPDAAVQPSAPPSRLRQGGTATDASRAELRAAIDGIVSMAARVAPPFDERSARLDRVLRAATSVGAADLDDGIQRLLPALIAPDPYCGGMAAMTVGALIECGAEPAPASKALRSAVATSMNAAARFAFSWKLGTPPATRETHIEDREAIVADKLGVHGAELQAWAAREPMGARAWSRMDDWFLPLMALARFSEQARDEIRADAELRAAYESLAEADRLMFFGAAIAANSNAGRFVQNLIVAGEMPAFGD